MRKTNEQSMKEVFDDLLKAYGLDQRMAEKRLINSWPILCGPMIARYTKSMYIKSKVLYLHMDNAVVREELMFSKEKLKEKLNGEAGMVVIDNIVIR